MSDARTRQNRRKGVSERAPGVLRGAFDERALTERSVGHGIRRGGQFSWRIISGVIAVSLSFVLVMFFVTDFFYIRSVEVAGTNFLTAAEVFRYADIAEQHVFWINPETVRENILQSSPVIADVSVTVRWPPNAVRIVIEEREAALIWIQAGVIALVDVHGRVLRFPREGVDPLPEGLITVNAVDTGDGPPGGDVLVDTDAINGALQLQNLLPGITALSYNGVDGLGFREPGGWDVWLGTGTDMRNKLLIYDALTANLQARGITPQEINVADPTAAHYCCQATSGG
ncbi:MAG: FtsQ-type POTRA domain-containing protein [Aggregatilineales bacterium]